MDSFAAARFPVLPLSADVESSVCAESSKKVEVSDEHLLSRIASGDKEALGLLFQRYARLVHSIGRRILRDDSEAEDLVQDLFLFIQRKCSVFDGSKSSARSWTVQMAYHRAIERRRHLTTRQFYSGKEIEGHTSQMVGTPTAECDYSADAVFGRNGLNKVLESLSEDQRETLRLHFFDGYTLSEISQKVGQPLGNVRHHYYRALNKLRRQMFRNNVPVDQQHGK
jgi:RNA polymerase sigma-70 factor, ECF subfamily